MYPVLIDFEKLKKQKKLFLKIFLKNGIRVQIHYKPTHLFSYYYKKYKNKLQIAETFFKQELSLPIFFNLKIKDIYKIVKILKNFTKIK